MAAERIQVDLTYIEDVLVRMTKVVGSFAEVRSLHGEVQHAPKTADALASFHSGWDLHRDELSQEMDGLRTGLLEIKRLFEQLDTELATSLTSDE